MTTLQDLATNLAAAGIGAIAVTAWHAIVMRRRFRGSRRFWRPFVAERALCVSGNIDPRDFAESFSSSIDAANRELIGAVLPLLEQDLIRQELSGLMGRGDHDAIVEVQAGLARIGLKPTLPEVTEANLSAAQLSGNLIVVGGPDVNSITRSLLGRLPAKLSIVRNADGRNIVRDLVHGHDFVPAEDESGRIRDYGILVRAANPDDRQKNVLILAGAHGFGTLAAAMVAFDKENLDRMLRSGSGFECSGLPRKRWREGGGSDQYSVPHARVFIAVGCR